MERLPSAPRCALIPVRSQCVTILLSESSGCQTSFIISRITAAFPGILTLASCKFPTLCRRNGRRDTAGEAFSGVGLWLVRNDRSRVRPNSRKAGYAASPGAMTAKPTAKPILDILSQIKDSYSELRPAERRVADVVLADVTFSVDASNAEIAKRAEVSEPTVTRFCRAIGCDGVRDFKLKLAQSVVVGGSVSPRRRRPARSAPMPHRCGPKCFGEARNALNLVERQIDPLDVIAAAELVGQRPPGAGVRLGGSSDLRWRLETQNRLSR